MSGKIKINGYRGLGITPPARTVALFGQTCFAPGEAKSNYGTGSFLLLNTGNELVRSTHGLLSTVGYKIGQEPAVYALEGSIAVTESLVQWFRDRLGLISTAAEIETLARTVEDNGGCYIVPTFSGLFAPYWRGEARGIIVRLTSYITKGHLSRAVQRPRGAAGEGPGDDRRAPGRIGESALMGC